MRVAARIIVLGLLATSAWAAGDDPAPIPQEVIDKVVMRPLHQGVNPLPDRVEQKLDATREQLDRLERSGVAARLTPADAASVAANSEDFEALRQEARTQMAAARARLLALGLRDQVKKLDAQKLAIEERFDRVTYALNALRDAKNDAGRRAARQQVKVVLQALRKPEDPKAFQHPITTFGYDIPLVSKPQQPAKDLPDYLASSVPRGIELAYNGDLMMLAGTPPVTPPEATQCSYTAADLDKSATAQFEVRATPEITALADTLDYSPVKIYKWVYDNIAYEPYYGSLKGAQGTLLSRAGNDTDQASLLIALLRVSNIPARYIKGQVMVMDAAPAGANARIAKWVGAKSYDAAANILAQGRNPSVGFITNAGSQKIGVSLVHVWVEACVPYGRYRGAQIDSGSNRWIPLDPSFKDKTYQPGIATSVNFDYSGYLANRKNGPDSLPHESYAKQVETSIKTSNPNATLEDVPYSGRINSLKIDVLPASLPYNVNQFLAWAGGSSAEVAALPDSHRYKYMLTVSNAANTTLATTTLPLPEHILKRITLSPKGATASDQTALDAWRMDGNVSSAAPCTINVVPVIKSEGVDVVAGTAAVGLCTANNRLNLQVLLPELAAGDCNSASAACINGVTYTNIGAANYHALQAYGFQASNPFLALRANKLLTSVKSIANPNTNLEETEGEYLNVVGLKYMRYISDANKSVGRLDGGSGDSGNHLGLTSSQMKVAYLFDLPFAVNRTGFLIDVPGGRSRNVELTSGALIYKTFLLAGYSSSAYESYIWQENSRMDAVSTVRGIQFARETGIEVLTLTSANWSVTGDTACANTSSQCYKFTHNTNAELNYSTAEVNAIKTSYIDQGNTVTIPRSLIQYNNWRGSVYVAEKNALPTSAQAAFIISGGYAGGYTTTAPLAFDYNPSLNTGYFDPPIVPLIANPANLPPISVGGGAVGNGMSVFNSWAGDPVNMVTGNVYHVERDISIPGRGGLPIVFERSYNSRAATLDTTCVPMGCGWTHSFNHYLKFYGVEGGMAKVSWVDGTGNEKFFGTTAHTNGNITLGTTLSNPPGIFVTFKRETSGVYTIREKNGLTYTFANVAGTTTGGQRARLDKIVDRNANTLNLVYDASNLLAQVKDTVGASGRALTFTYTGGRITQITDFASPARSYQYTYEADGDLASFKNPLAVSSPGTQPPVNYAYYTAAAGANVNHALLTYTLPRGNGMKFEYYSDGRAFRHSTLACATTPTAPTCQVNTFTYNDFRREAVQVSERGYARRFFFDQYGNPLQIIEESGAKHVYTYDAAKPYNRLSKTDPLGYRTSYAYDASDNVTQITTPRLATVTFDNFTAYNQPQRVKDARGNYTVVKYDAAGNVLEEIRIRSGVVPAIPYTPVAGDVVAWTINTYGAFGNLLTTKRVKNAATPAGQAPVLSFTYDANSLYPTAVSRVGDKNGDGVNDAADSKTLVYDAVGRVTTGIDGDWHTTSFTYDTVDRVVTGTDPVGKVRTYSYDQNGNLAENKLVIATVTYDRVVYSYDNSDRRTLATDYGNGTGTGNAMSTTAYDVAGNPIKITDPDGYTLGFDYDEANRAVRAYDQEGNHVYLSRDLDGKPKCTRDPNGNAVFYTYWDKSRDARLKRVTAPKALACPGAAPTSSTRAVEYDYDANGNVISVTEIGSDNTTRLSFTSYDELNRPVQAIGPSYTDATLGSIRPVTQYSYNLLGHVTQVQAGYCASAAGGCAAAAVLSTQVTNVFDDFGRKIRETDPNGKFWAYSYDVNNNPVQLTDAKGQVTTLTWNYGHLLATRTNLAAGNVALAYNNLGLVTTANTKVAGSAATDLINYGYTYDALNRLNTLTDSRGGVVLDYDVSPGGRLNKLKDSHGNETNYVYDAVGRLASIWAPNYGTVSYRYDAGGRLLEKWLPNGVTARYSWNADNTLASLVNRRAATSVISQHSYLYDAFGNRSRHTESINGAALTYNYTYDSLDRLLTVTNGTVAQDQAYQYDPLNNLKAKTLGTPVTATTNYIYDAANQLLETRDGANTLLSAFVLDGNGAITKKCIGGTVTRTATDCTGATVAALGYDSLNRLVQGTLGATTETYAYDDQGRRIRKISGATTTNYLYNGPDINAEYGTSYTAPNALYVHGPNWDDPIMRLTGQGTAAVPTYYHQDGLGSAVATSTATGTVAATQRFDAWGNKLSGTGSIAQYGYTGRELDATGLVYYRARYYDPTIGRFTQRDPIGLLGGINQYAYVHGNPINFTDPNGLLARQAQAWWNETGKTYYNVLADTAGDYAQRVVTGQVATEGLQRLENSLNAAVGDPMRGVPGDPTALLEYFGGGAGSVAGRVANKTFDVNKTFRGGNFREITINPGTQLERAFEGGVTNPIGSFTTRGATARRIQTTDDAVRELNLGTTSGARPNFISTLEATAPVKAKIGFVEDGGKNAIQIVIDPADRVLLKEVGRRPLGK